MNSSDDKSYITQRDFSDIYLFFERINGIKKPSVVKILLRRKLVITVYDNDINELDYCILSSDNYSELFDDFCKITNKLKLFGFIVEEGIWNLDQIKDLL